MSDATGQSTIIKPGTILPTEEKKFTAADLVMYGAATWDWHRLHYDTTFTETMNLPKSTAPYSPNKRLAGLAPKRL